MKKPLRIVSIGLALLLWGGMFTLPAFATDETTSSPAPTESPALDPTPTPEPTLPPENNSGSSTGNTE